jgi:hypothetical protein
MNGQYFTPDIPLTNVSQAYRPDPTQFIAEIMLPMVSVPKKNFNIYYYGKENVKQVVDDTRTRFGETKIAEMSISSKPFGPLRGHELMDGIDFDQDEMTEAPLDMEIDITNFLSDQMALTKEIAAATLLSNTSVLTQNSTPTAKWDDYITNPTGYTSNPFLDLKAAAEQVRLYGLRPVNCITFSYYTFSVLQQHPALLERVKYSNLASITMDMMMQLFGQFGIQKILVSGAVKDTAGQNLAASDTFVWGPHCWLSFVTPTPGLRQVNGGYTFTLENGRFVDSWYEQKRKTKWIRNNDYYVQQIVGPEAYYLLTNVVASAS